MRTKRKIENTKGNCNGGKKLEASQNHAYTKERKGMGSD